MSNAKEIILAYKARKYAFEILTCPDTDCTAEEAIEAWNAGAKEPIGKTVIVWQPFENYTAEELLEELENLEQSFLRFAEELAAI